MQFLIDLMERGLLPDPLTRLGIRHILRQRLRNQSAGDCSTQLSRNQSFIAQLGDSQIAVNTSDANEQHYELPADFFETVLGPHLKYSSGWWPEGVDSLAEAEEAMLELTCHRADVGDKMDILDLGCGWGSLSLWVARHHPSSRVLAVSNSRSQAEFIRTRCQNEGIDNLKVVTADMNDFDPGRRFDRVLSVEMFEHMRNWPELYRRIANWLKPGGLMLMHVFCHREFVYPYVAQDASDWMARYFFTGGMMPSDDLPYHCSDDLTVDHHWRINGRHYSATLEAWLDLMDANRSQLMPLFETVYGSEAGRWFERWRVFFMACAELFAFSEGNEWWVSHYRLKPRAEVRQADHPGPRLVASGE